MYQQNLSEQLSQRALTNFTASPIKTRISDYEIDESSIITQTNHKIIYRGQRLNYQTKVIIKVINNFSDSVKMKSLLHNLLKSLKETNSPYLLKYIQVVVEESNIYLIAQNIDRKFEDCIEENTNFTDEEIIRMWVQLCSALVKVMKNNRQLKYQFNMSDVYVLQKVIKLDCLTAIETNRTGQINPKQFEENSVEEILYNLQLCVHSLNERFKSKDKELLNLIIASMEKWKVMLKQQKKLRLEVMQSSLTAHLQLVQKNRQALNKSYCAIDKVLMNELNYVVFLHRLSADFQNFPPIPTQHFASLVYVFKYHAKARINRLTRILKHKHSNIFKMPNWETYIKHKNFSTYLSAITHLSNTVPMPPKIKTRDERIKDMMVEDCYVTESLILNYQFYLRKVIEKLTSMINLKSSSLIERKKEDILMLDYLLSAYQLNALNIEYYQDSYAFALESYLDTIVKGTPVFDSKMCHYLNQKLRMLEF